MNVISSQFDQAAIHSHIWMLHHLAKRASVPGKLVLSAIACKSTGLPIVNQHFEIGDVDGMVAAAMAFEATRYGVYSPYCIMRHGLERGSKGEQDDVIATLAYPVDSDGDHKGKPTPHAPVTPDYIVESSSGNFQEIMILDRPLFGDDAKSLALALKEVTGDKNCVGDISRVMRVPGTLNWPSQSKLGRGRSPDPQPVRVQKAWDKWTTVDALRAAVAAHKKPDPVATEQSEPNEELSFRPRYEEVEWWIKRKLEKHQQAPESEGYEYLDVAMFGGALKLRWPGDDGLELFKLIRPDDAANKWKGFKTKYVPGKTRTLHWYLERREAKDVDWMFRAMAGCPMPPAAPLGPLPIGSPLPEGWHWNDEGKAAPFAPKKLIQSSAEFVANFVAPAYLLDGILQKRFCYSLTAATGAGKTAITLRLAAHVALGRKIGDRDVERGRVLYFAAENYVDVQARWIAMAEHCGFDVDAIDVHFVPGTSKLSEIAERITKEAQELGDLVLVIVDTSAATFEGADENSNVDGLQHAKRMRGLTDLRGNPTVLVLCHPVKSATNDNLLPRGGGSFIAEIDGNLCARKNESAVEVHWAGKFRGMDFAPMMFRLDTIVASRLKDVRGRNIPTVMATPIDDAGRQVLAETARSDQDLVLRAIEKDPGASSNKLAESLGWKMRDGKPYGVRVRRAAEKLASDGLLLKHRGEWVLSSAGQKELNHLDRNYELTPMLPTHAVAGTSAVPLPRLFPLPIVDKQA